MASGDALSSATALLGKTFERQQKAGRHTSEYSEQPNSMLLYFYAITFLPPELKLIQKSKLNNLVVVVQITCTRAPV